VRKSKHLKVFGKFNRDNPTGQSCVAPLSGVASALCMQTIAALTRFDWMGRNVVVVIVVAVVVSTRAGEKSGPQDFDFISSRALERERRGAPIHRS
jgi:hypothetical protein